VRQLLLTKATAARARKEGFDRKPEVKEVISNLIDQFIAQEYLSKVVIADISVSDDDIKKYYLGHEKDFLVAEAARVRHIYISSPKDSSAELKEKARSKAEMILNQVKKGEDFAKIAKEQSEDADSAVKGGDLGFITAGKTNSPDFEKAVFALKAGEVGSLVETPFGYHVIRVDERKESRTATIEEGKDYIISLLKEQGRQKKGQEFLDALSKESGLEIVGEKTESAK
jgi:peptidyl-prolyl cis-trans isomerase C